MGLRKRLRSIRHKIQAGIGPKIGGALSVALPAAGAVFLGPLGAAAGTATGTAASALLRRPRGRRKAIKRGLITGGAITAGTAGIGLLSGSGIMSPLTTSIPNLFGAGGTASPFGKLFGGSGSQPASTTPEAQNPMDTGWGPTGSAAGGPGAVGPPSDNPFNKIFNAIAGTDPDQTAWGPTGTGPRSDSGPIWGALPNLLGLDGQGDIAQAQQRQLGPLLLMGGGLLVVMMIARRRR